jgi:hypothetical protein
MLAFLGKRASGADQTIALGLKGPDLPVPRE